MEPEIIQYMNIVMLQYLNYLSSLIEKNHLMTTTLSILSWNWLDKWINFRNLSFLKKCVQKFVHVTIIHRTKPNKDTKFYMEDTLKHTEDLDKIIRRQILI